MLIAAPAGSDDVFPDISSAFGDGVDVVAGEFADGEAVAAVQAGVLVPCEQGAVIEWGAGPGAGHSVAAAGDDGGEVEGGAFAEAIDAAVHGLHDTSQGPGDELPHVQAGGLFPGEPFEGLAGEIQPQDLRLHEFTSRFCELKKQLNKQQSPTGNPVGPREIEKKSGKDLAKRLERSGKCGAREVFGEF